MTFENSGDYILGKYYIPHFCFLCLVCTTSCFSKQGVD